MIIKKPYAFLIKHFRIIHAILFGLLIYIVSNTFNIYSFFSNYAKTHIYVNTTSLVDSYTSILLFVITISAIIITFIIYYILNMKQKSNKTYLFIIMYYILLIIYFIYIRGVFTGLEEKSMDVESIRAMRDISIIIIVPQFIILFILLGRTLGFNLKQFDFKKDLEELEIDTSDNEEVEVTLGSDTYKIARFFRKMLRLSKYFILENKLFVIGVSSILLLIISFTLIKNSITEYKQNYYENQTINSSLVSFKINSSYLTQTDKNNVVIAKGKYYLLIDISISNKSSSNYTINGNTFRLELEEELLHPSFTFINRFSDIGDVFSKKDLSKNYTFKIANLINSVDGDHYKDVIITPKNLGEEDKGNMTIPNKVELSDSILKKSTVQINSFEFKERFKEEYTYTLNGEEKKAIYTVLPDTVNKKEMIILKLDASIKIDPEAYMSKYINYPGDLFEQYGLVRYRYQGNYITVKLLKNNVKYNKDKYCYLELTKEVLKANKIELILLIRGIKYTFILK